ncbi:unnamed protein product [Allacma fusca]|uniref:Uncharacterized protein n=1 Tax=Allacma fusca TaxID=39272 RepID=A0A8J2LF57_9HEXA|nr:unnamed protein product [Allacma fusca]
MAKQSTPWQSLKFYRETLRIREGKPPCKKESPVDPCCYPNLTYYHNGKENVCCKPRHDYNFLFCEGYDQYRHRDDRKHPHFYLGIDIEEKYPCRRVPLLTSSNYGHRPPIDPMGNRPKQKQIHTFYRNSGTSYCLNANGYHNVRLIAPWALKDNEQFGYTYSPPRK